MYGVCVCDVVFVVCDDVFTLLCVVYALYWQYAICVRGTCVMYDGLRTVRCVCVL